MDQDANDDEAVADLLAQKNSTDGKRQDVQVDQRNRNNEMVGIRDRANGPQDQCDGQPRRSVRSDILPQKGHQRNPLAKTVRLRGLRFSDSEMYEVIHSKRIFAIIPLSS